MSSLYWGANEGNAELTAGVAAAWQAYDSAVKEGNPLSAYMYTRYRALANQQEKATGFDVTCGALTGRPA